MILSENILAKTYCAIKILIYHTGQKLQ